jgi:hypothetical protein
MYGIQQEGKLRTISLKHWPRKSGGYRLNPTISPINFEHFKIYREEYKKHQIPPERQEIAFLMKRSLLRPHFNRNHSVEF